MIARQLLGEANPLATWSAIEQGYASRLLPVELGRLFDRLRLSGSIDDLQRADLHQELRRMLRSIAIVALTEPILRLAAGPMPTQLGSLDAIHLASALELQRELGKPVVLATHDARLARASRAMGLDVRGV